ncbi:MULTISPECIES: transporter substrate-binding domain-containing protein [unclassified Salinibacterium]|uniref:transporter substrate-binding domain-containing protein n=1 Tax=unclassified Salinibacterium TaxID=2632331 RepID=UPI00143CCB9F|nr:MULTISPECIES: transporter substrate-binding domain-containing protein [unclassified Salinibacterium]
MASFSRRLAAPAFLAAAALLVGCSSGTAGEADSAPAAGNTDAPAYDLLPQEFKDSGVIRIAMASTAPPYSSAAGGEWSGLIPELGMAAEPMLGIDIEIVDTPYTGQIAALKAGKVDMVWGATYDNVDTEAVVDLASYMRSAASPMTLKSKNITLEEPEDMCGHIVGTIAGGGIQVYLENFAKDCEASGKPMDLRLYDTSSGATAQLQSGQIEVLLGIDLIQRYAAKTLNDGAVFEVHDVQVLPSIYGMAFTKGDTELQEAMMEAVRQIMKNGEYSKVFAAYDAEKYELTPDEVMINGVGAGKL